MSFMCPQLGEYVPHSSRVILHHNVKLADDFALLRTSHDLREKKAQNKFIPLVKVVWEIETRMKEKYPHFFS